MPRWQSELALARRLLKHPWCMVLRRANGATTLITLTPARLTVIMGRRGLTAASSSVSGRGTAGAGDTAGVAAATDTDAADTVMDAAAMQPAADTLAEFAVELQSAGAQHRRGVADRVAELAAAHAADSQAMQVVAADTAAAVTGKLRL